MPYRALRRELYLAVAAVDPGPHSGAILLRFVLPSEVATVASGEAWAPLIVEGRNALARKPWRVDEFIVARNPDAASSLPYVVRLPIDGGLWLKAKETWPRASRVYCHPCEPFREQDLEIVERVGVRACIRRGSAIDLLLARGNNKRSQFVSTTFRGRPMILWQTPKAAASARPGVRIPFGKATPIETIYVDTRERYGYKFAAHGVRITRKALPAGDYAVQLGGSVAAVERKTLDNFASSLTDASLNYTSAWTDSRSFAPLLATRTAAVRSVRPRPGLLSAASPRHAGRTCRAIPHNTRPAVTCA